MVFTWLDQAYAVLGQPIEQQDCLATAARLIEATDERVHEAELLYRVPGDLKAVGDQSGPSEAIIRPLLLPSGRAQSSSSCGTQLALRGSGAIRAGRRSP
jgi:hypothetical protein